MKEKLIQYVELLFAGAQDCEDIKQEILQNTLDRYDDLIAEGRVPEAAYRLAIAGIGDISEILGTAPKTAVPVSMPKADSKEETDTPAKKLLRAVAVGLYILCPIPLIVLSQMGMDIFGLCGTLGIVAVATVLIMLGTKNQAHTDNQEAELTPKQQLRKSITRVTRTAALILFFVLGSMTDGWFAAWLVFPLGGAVKQLIYAILDYKEVQHEEV